MVTVNFLASPLKLFISSIDESIIQGVIGVEEMHEKSNECRKSTHRGLYLYWLTSGLKKEVVARL